MNGSLPEKSEPLSDSCYEPLAREAKMPKAQLSKAPAVSYSEFQLDILTKLAEHIVHIDGANEGSVSPVGSAEGKRPEFVSAKGRAESAPRTPSDH